MKYFALILIYFTFTFSFSAWPGEEPKHKDSHSHGDDSHDHDKKSTKPDKHEHEDRHEHEHEKDEHEHGEHEDDKEGEHEHEEGGSNVGPDKGILEASEESGIKLSHQALKNFEIKTVKLSGSAPWTIPASARLFSGEEVNLYRLRNGSFKRIDFSLLNRTPEQITVNAKELQPGDEIVINGIGFLRIAEIAAFGGAPEGHSH